jgi:hypothetical protein
MSVNCLRTKAATYRKRVKLSAILPMKNSIQSVFVNLRHVNLLDNHCNCLVDCLQFYMPIIVVVS